MLVLQASIRGAYSALDNNFLAIPNMGGSAEETAIYVDNKPQSEYNTPTEVVVFAQTKGCKKWENIEIQR